MQRQQQSYCDSTIAIVTAACTATVSAACKSRIERTCSRRAPSPAKLKYGEPRPVRALGPRLQTRWPLKYPWTSAPSRLANCSVCSRLQVCSTAVAELRRCCGVLPACSRLGKHFLDLSLLLLGEATRQLGE